MKKYIYALVTNDLAKLITMLNEMRRFTGLEDWKQ